MGVYRRNLGTNAMTLCNIFSELGPVPKTCPEQQTYLAAVTRRLPLLDQIKYSSGAGTPTVDTLNALWGNCNPPTYALVTWYDSTNLEYQFWFTSTAGFSWLMLSAIEALLYIRILNTEYADLIGLWKLDEAGGAGTAVDSSSFGHDGTPSNVTFAGDTTPEGINAATFNGSTSYINVYSASISAVFGYGTGTLLTPFKVSAAGVWTDGNARTMANFATNANNKMEITKSNANNTIFARYNAGGVSRVVSVNPYNSTNWALPCATWDVGAGATGEMKFFIDGVQQGSTQTNLGTWAGVLASNQAVIGALNTTPSQVRSGSAALVALWRIALTPTQVTYVSSF